MTDNSKLAELIDALEKRITALEKEVLISKMKAETHQDFQDEMKGYVKRFYYTVTISLGAIILWVAKAIVEKVGLGF